MAGSGVAGNVAGDGDYEMLTFFEDFLFLLDCLMD
jgi:hypothetical protein